MSCGVTEDDAAVKVLIEIPKGSRNKYELDRETGRMELDRRLFTSLSYPTEYGFVPGTRGADGDELDALVFVSEPTFPGCLVPARVIGVLKMRMGTGDGPANSKLVCVPFSDPEWNDVHDAGDLRHDLRAEVAHFFEVYKDLEEGAVQVEGWEGRDAALDELRRARERHRT
jgi:inorganic pyrophosphatase